MEYALALLFVVVTVVCAAVWLAPNMADGRVVFDLEPEPPKPFGYRMSWLAIRSRDTDAVIAALGLEASESANWSSGLGTVYDAKLGADRIFVSPPVNGWTLVVGHALPQPASRRLVDKTTPLLMDLADRFVEVQYFSSYPHIDFFAWARVIEGRMIRAFAINDAGTVWNRGRPTREERGLGLRLFDVRGVRGRKGDAGEAIVIYPTEEHMMQLAAKWSLDPTRLNVAEAGPSIGVIGRAPARWRSERIGAAREHAATAAA